MVTLSATTYMKYKINQSAQTILMATTNVTTKYEIQDKSVCTNDIVSRNSIILVVFRFIAVVEQIRLLTEWN